MRLIATLLFFIPAWAAMAIGPPGPPPWSCSLEAACNAAEMCITLNALPIRFKLIRVDGVPNSYHLEGPDDFESTALELPTLVNAQHFAESDRSNKPTPFILIPNSEVHDAHGFWLHSIYTRGDGQRFLSDDKMLVSCNSIRKS